MQYHVMYFWVYVKFIWYYIIFFDSIQKDILEYWVTLYICPDIFVVQTQAHQQTDSFVKQARKSSSNIHTLHTNQGEGCRFPFSAVHNHSFVESKENNYTSWYVFFSQEPIYITMLFWTSTLVNFISCFFNFICSDHFHCWSGHDVVRNFI